MAGTKKDFLGGLSPAKVGAIIVLSIVLLAVLVVQYSGGGGGPVAVKKKRSRKPTGSVEAADASEETETEADDQEARQWPEIPRAEVLLHDPFQLPIFLDPDAGADGDESQTNGEGAEEQGSEEQRRAALLASLRSTGVGMILKGPRGKVAHIGEFKVQEGDLLEGLRVVEIHSRGIVLERVLSPAEADPQLDEQANGRIEGSAQEPVAQLVEEPANENEKTLGVSATSLGIEWLKSRMRQVLGTGGSTEQESGDVEAKEGETEVHSQPE